MSQSQSLEKILLGSKKAILIGIGGGGDIVGTLPTARLLELFNIEYILGGLPWERSVIDPTFIMLNVIETMISGSTIILRASKKSCPTISNLIPISGQSEPTVPPSRTPIIIPSNKLFLVKIFFIY